MRIAAHVLAAASWLAAPADERPLSEAVSVASADECVTGAALAAHLGSWLGRDTLDARIVIVVEVGAGEAAFEILADGASVGTRRFDRLPAECADRRAVISLAISLALDDGVLDAFTAPPALGTGEAVAGAAPALVLASVPTPPAADARVGVALEIEAAALVGLLFDPVLLGAVDVRVLLPDGLSLRVGAIVSGVAAGALGAGQVEVALRGGRASVCLGRVVAAPVAIEGCLGAWAGAVHAEGRGFSADRAVDLGLVAPTARIAVRIEPLPWLAFFVGIEGVVSVLRPRVLVEGSGTGRDLGDVGLSIGGGGALVLR